MAKKPIRRKKDSNLTCIDYYVPKTWWGGASLTKTPGLTVLFKQRVFPNKVRAGVPVPRWAWRIDNGLDATSGYTSRIRTGKIEIGFIYRLTPYSNFTTVAGKKYYTGNGFYQDVNVSPEWFSSGDIPAENPTERTKSNNLAVAKFSDKVRERLQTVSGPTFLGEIRQALELIRKPGRSIEKLILRYNKQVWRRLVKKRYDPRRVAEYARKKYLEFTFGVQPLMSDIKGAAEALAKVRFMPSLDVRVRTSTTIPVVTSTITSTNFLGSSSSKVTYSTSISGKIRQDVISPPGSADRLAQLLGFSWDEFIPTAYELVPYSFVVDYFSNMNAVLSSRYASSAYLAWRSSTTRVVRTRSIRYIPRDTGNPIFGSSTEPGATTRITAPGVIEDSLIDITRTKGTPQIRLMLETPSFKQLFNVGMLGSFLRKTNSHR